MLSYYDSVLSNYYPTDNSLLMPPRKDLKKYVTVKNGLIAFVVVGVLILILTGVGISEWKKKNREFNLMAEELKRVDEQFKQKVFQDSLKIDSLETKIELKREKSRETIIKVIHERDKNIERITSREFSNDNIRNSFAN